MLPLILITLVVADTPEPTIVNNVKPELLSKADFEKAKDLVIKLPEIKKQIEKYGKDYTGEAYITNAEKEPTLVRFFFRVRAIYLAQSITVNTKEWKVSFKAYQDPEDQNILELEKLKEKLKKKEKDE